MTKAMTLPMAMESLASVAASRIGSGENQRVVVNCMDSSLNATGFCVQRATTLAGPWTTVATVPAAGGAETTLSHTDATVARGTSYYYRIVASHPAADRKYPELATLSDQELAASEVIGPVAIP